MNLRATLLLLTTAGSIVTACSGAPAAAPADPGSNATAAPATQPGASTTVTFWFQPDEGSQSNCFVATAITPFNEQANGVTVEAVAQPNVWDATRTAIAGGAGPDIVETPGPSFAFELVQADQLVALDELAKSENWTGTFVPWALDLGRVNGTLYSLPTQFETLVLYYNKTLFAEKGWQVPQTMDELVALSSTINAAGVIPFAHSNAEWRPTNEWFVGTFFNRIAGPDRVYQALTGKAKWTDPEFVRAVEELTRVQTSGYFMGGLDRYYTAIGTERLAAFGSGAAAMNIEGTWAMGNSPGSMSSFFGTAAGNENEWDWIAIPSTRPNEQVFDIGIGSTYSINKTAKDPQAAAKYLTYLLSPETQARLLRECGTAPAPVRLDVNAFEGVDPRTAAIFTAMSKASDAGTYGYTTWTFWPPKSGAYIYEEIEKVWAGEMTAEEYLAGLQTLFDEEFAANELPPIPAR